MSTLVTGATGRIGGATVEALVALGHQPIALVRAPDRVNALRHPIPSRVGDLADPAALTRAVSDVDSVLLCSGHAPNMQELQLNLIAAARRSGVRRIVKISTSPASAFPGTPSAVAAQHLELEAALAESGIEHTNLRPNAFTQLLGGFAPSLARGELSLTLGEASLSWVDARDVGAVAAAALLADGPLPHHIEVTGPEALTGHRLAQILGEAIGRRVEYKPISDEENRRRLLAAGAPAWLAEHVVVIFSLLRDHGGHQVTDAVLRWVGRPATPVHEVVAREGKALGITPATAQQSTEDRPWHQTAPDRRAAEGR